MNEKKGFSTEELTELKGVLADVESKMGTKAADQIAAELGKVEKQLSAKYDAEMSELKKFKVDAAKTMADNQKFIDEQVSKSKIIPVTGNGSASDIIAKAMEEKKALFEGYKSTKKGFALELKTVGNIGANSNITVSGTPAFKPGPAMWEPGRKGFEVQHVRDLCRVVPQGEGTDAYVIRDAGGEGGPTAVAVGAVKPQSDRDWVKTIIPITKIAHYYKIPEEYLSDIAWMQDEVTGVGVEELLVKEDTDFLTASGSSTQFAGLNQTLNSTAYSTPTALTAFFTGSGRAASSNNYDVLVAAMTQLRLANPSSRPNVILINPGDYAKMLLTKDTTNKYVFGSPYSGFPSVQGIPIVSHNTVTTDKFFLGDFSKVKVGVRAGLTVRFYDQNENDAIYNLVTVVIEERVTIAADRADRIIYGDFSDAQTALES